MTNLRSALDELTEGRAAPADLAGTALTGAARRRVRRRVLTGAAVVVAVVAAVGVPTALLRSDPDRGPVGNGEDGTAGGQRYAIVSYDAYTDETLNPGRAWDPERHAYVKTGYQLSPSPDGAWALVSDDNQQRWAVARWSDAVHRRNLHWQPYAKPVGDYMSSIPPVVHLWAATGATLLAISMQGQVISYLDPATLQGPSVPWPAAMSGRGAVYVGGIGVYQDQITFRVVEYGKPVRFVVVGPGGKVTRVVNIPHWPNEWIGRPYDQVSPDGRYVQVAAGVVIDLATGGSSVFGGNETRSGFDEPFLVGWYDNTHLMQVQPGEEPGKPHKPVLLSIMDIHGHAVRTIELPGFGPGRTDVHLIPAGPDTEGAVLVRI